LKIIISNHGFYMSVDSLLFYNKLRLINLECLISYYIHLNFMKKMKNLYFLANSNFDQWNLNYFHPNYFILILYFDFCLGFFVETYNNFRFKVYASLFPTNLREIDFGHQKFCWIIPPTPHQGTHLLKYLVFIIIESLYPFNDLLKFC
jgi:hypothetical protein